MVATIFKHHVYSGLRALYDHNIESLVVNYAEWRVIRSDVFVLPRMYIVQAIICGVGLYDAIVVLTVLCLHAFSETTDMIQVTIYLYCIAAYVGVTWT